VEGQVIDKWSTGDAEQLAVWSDFPRVVRHIQAFDEKLKLIQLPYTLKEENLTQSESDYDEVEHSLKNMRETLILFSYRLSEKKELVDIEKHFLTTLGVEPSIHLKNFFATYISKSSRLLALLKGLNQTILAPPYISLKTKFAALDLPILDVNGSWLIEVVFKTEEIIIIHSKKANSISLLPEERFSFRWHIAIAFDRQMINIKEVRLSMTELEMNKQIRDKTKKKKLQSIKDHELFL